MIGQNSLKNFYQSLQFSYPAMAEELGVDISCVGLYALGQDKSEGQVIADRLRDRTRDLPEVFRRVLESALTELGYS